MKLIDNLTNKTGKHAKRVITNYNDMLSWRKTPVMPEFLEKEAQRMIQFYLDNPKALTLLAYINHRGIHMFTMNRWLKKHKPLREAYDFCKQLLCQRREEGMLRGELKERATMYMMHRYSQAWDEADKRWVALKEKEDSKNKPTNITVVMEDFSRKEEKSEKSL